MLVKTAIIGAYICHKIYWKATHKEKSIKWGKFFEVKR